MTDALRLLQPCSWRGIQFPTTSIELEFEQDLVEHRYYGIDGARIESTGRGPIGVTVNIPLVNGIARGSKETWQTLYPGVFRTLYQATQDRTAGTLVHPELGELVCKVKRLSFRHDGHEARDGTHLVAHFVVTNVFSSQVITPSPVSQAAQAAIELDSAQTIAISNSAPAAAAAGRPPLNMKALVPTPAMPPFDLATALDAVSALGDRFSTDVTVARGTVDRYAYHVNRLLDSAARARNALFWPVVDSANRAQSALTWMREHPPSQRPILTHTVRVDSTIPDIMSEIPTATLADILALNPQIAASHFVRAFTAVRYYAPR